MSIPNPSLALDVLASWSGDPARPSPRFQGFAAIAARNEVNDFEMFYESFVGLAVFTVDMTVPFTGGIATDMFTTLSQDALRGATPQRTADLRPYLNRVASTLHRRDDKTVNLIPVPTGITDLVHVARVLSALCAFTAMLITTQADMSKTGSMRDAIARYQSAINSVLDAQA